MPRTSCIKPYDLAPCISAPAFQGTGVFETLKEIAKQVLMELKAGR
jgi:hypothetical protein